LKGIIVSLYTLLGASLLLLVINSWIYDRRVCSQRMKAVGWCFKGLLLLAIVLSAWSLYQSYEALSGPVEKRQEMLATWVTWLMNSIAIGHLIAVAYALFLVVLFLRSKRA